MPFFRRSRNGSEKESLPPITLESVQTWEPQDGDVLILTSKDRLTPDACVRLRDQIRAMFPENRLMILDRGMTFTVATGEVELPTTNTEAHSGINPGRGTRTPRGSRAEGPGD